MVLRTKAAKTEPAFANALSQDGDPYCAMSDLSGASDTALAAMLAAKGFVLQERKAPRAD
jgi:hypothetical protein